MRLLIIVALIITNAITVALLYESKNSINDMSQKLGSRSWRMFEESKVASEKSTDARINVGDPQEDLQSQNYYGINKFINRDKLRKVYYHINAVKNNQVLGEGPVSIRPIDIYDVAFAKRNNFIVPFKNSEYLVGVNENKDYFDVQFELEFSKDGKTVNWVGYILSISGYSENNPVYTICDIIKGKGEYDGDPKHINVMLVKCNNNRIKEIFK